MTTPTLADLAEPLHQCGERETLGQMAWRLRRGQPAAVRRENGEWYVLSPEASVGYADTRRLIDLPLQRVATLDASLSVREALRVLADAEAQWGVVMEEDRARGLVRRDRLERYECPYPRFLEDSEPTLPCAGLAHDMANLLSSLLALGELLAQDPRLTREAREMAEDITFLAERAGALARRLADPSPARVYERQPLDLQAYLEIAVPRLRRALPSTIALDLEPNPEPMMVEADALQLLQVLTNLVMNSRDAMPAGGTIRIALDGEDGMVALRFSDTGTGIAPEVLPYVFDVAFTTKEPGRGSGLGLSQVRRLVAAHGGSVEVASNGGGTTVTLRLPHLA